MRAITRGLVLSALLAAAATPAHAQREDFIVDQSTGMLQEFLRDPNRGVPPALLRRAEGVILFPRMIQGGFIGGARHGRGIVLMRDPETQLWSNPFFIQLTGGNVGFQVGLSSTELLLVFRDRVTIERFLLGQGKLTFGVDASAAAGPVGRGVGAESDPRFQADILTYSRGRGLYAGAVIGGSVAKVDHRSNWAYYRASVTPGEILNGVTGDRPLDVPQSAARLREMLDGAAEGNNPGARRPPAGEPLPPEAGDPIIDAPLPDPLPPA
jgi:lipid-binding SYLF domain-containing protein